MRPNDHTKFGSTSFGGTELGGTELGGTESGSTAWVKASASGANANCVELRRRAAAVEVRDTKQHGQGPTLSLAVTEFAAWLEAAKNGEFDQLA
jgi:hypothetical protein